MAKKKNADSSPNPERDDLLDVASLGKGIEEVYRRKIPLTTKTARRFLEEYEEFEGERPCDPAHVETLAKAMQRGTFQPSIALLALAEYRGKTYRVNGQHTTSARLQFEGDTDYDYEIFLVKYEVKTYEDLRNLYSAFDRNKTRNRSHVLHTQLAGYKGWKEILPKPIQSVAAAFPFFRWEDSLERKKYDVDEQAYMLKTDYLDLGVQVATFVQDHYTADYSHIRIRPVIAAMFASMEAAGEDAVPFWETVATGINISDGRLPAAKLRSFLLRHEIDRVSKKEKANTEEEVYRICVRLWNTWRREPKKLVANVQKNYTGVRFNAI